MSVPVLYRASFGYLLRHPWQLALALLGICIGVAVIVAVDLANESSRRAFLLSMDAINGEATHQVTGGPSGVDETLYAKLRTEHGIRNIAPVISGYVRHQESTLQVMGVDVFAEREFRNYVIAGNDEQSVVVAGDEGESALNIVSALLTTPGALLASPDTARQLGIDTGDRIFLSANGKQHEGVLIATFPPGQQRQLDNLLVTDIATAQQWLGMQGKLTHIDVRVNDDDDAILERLQDALPQDVQLLTAAGRTSATLGMSKAFMTNLTAMSLLALLVGVFLIYNSVAFAVLQRRKLIGVLRALGLTRAQTFSLILVEAFVLGVSGALIGLLAGVWLGEQLLHLVARSISDHYFVVNVTAVSLAPGSVIKGLLAGMGATLFAAAVPACEASAYSPRLAMMRSVLERRTGEALPLVAAVGLSAAFLAMFVLALSGDNLVAGLVALFLLILGFALLVPIAARIASAWLAPAVGRFLGSTGRMAISGVIASLSRTGVAIVALAVAVSATVGVSVMVDSFRGSVSDWLASTLQSDVYVSVPRGSIDPQLLDDIVQIQGIEHHSTVRRSWLETERGRVRLIAVDMAPGSYAGTTLRQGDPADIWPAFDNAGAVLVSDAYAYRNDVEPGDTVTISTGNGDRAFHIAAVYENYDSNDGAILMSRRTYDIFFDDPRVDSLGLYLSDAAIAERVMGDIRSISTGRQSLLVNSNARIREMSLDIFDRTFVITDVLYWLAVGVAVIGILGAMLALQLERARELATLRALGMTPTQVGSLVMLQTAFIGLLSGIAALPLGIIMAWVLIAVINRRSFGWQMDMTVDPAVLLSSLALALAAALLAGLYPAWRAAKARPALAMREE
ncbi:MAG: FtsX-like permease family protein [Woeseiaceae bacterium]|nr:FtsX-like permease family protein [Woeseiaceae bacterium]